MKIVVEFTLFVLSNQLRGKSVMNPLKLRDAFLKRVGVRHSVQLDGLCIKITIVRGLLYKQIENELVVANSFYMPPHANEKPVLSDTNMLYITFTTSDFDGLEMYLKNDRSFHAQLLSVDPSFIYEKIHVIINDVDLGWFDYREVVKPTNH